MTPVATVLAVALEAELARKLARTQKAANRARSNLDAATRTRDDAVRAAAAAGASLREIADAIGVSHVMVKKILDRRVQ